MFRVFKFFRNVQRKLVFVTIIEKTFRLLNSILLRFEYQVTYGIQDLNSSGKQSRKITKELTPRISDVALIVQGPISNPTILNKVLKLYRINYPTLKIILSTWKSDENVKYLELDKEVEVVLSNPPSDPGIQNINYQLISTANGILEAESEGFQFILKTRTDQAILGNYGVERVLYRWSDYQIGEHGRLLSTDFNTFMFRPFHLSDQLQFMSMQAAKVFWNKENLYKESRDPLDKEMFPERFLLMRYLEALGYHPNLDLKTGLEVFRDLCIVIDNEDVQLAWFKGSSRDLKHRFPQKMFPWEWSFLRFSDWIELQKDFSYYVDLGKSLEKMQ